MCKEILKRLDVLIRARTPVIGIESTEEPRIEEEIVTLIAQDNARRNADARHRTDARRTTDANHEPDNPKEVWTWSISRGFVRLLPDPEQQTPIPAPDPASAILACSGLRGDAPAGNARAVYILKDLHPYLGKIPQVARALRDAAGVMRKGFSTLVLISPSLDLPDDLKKEVRVITFPLPTAEELDDQIENFICNLPGTVPVNLNGQRVDLVRALQGLTKVDADAVLAQAVITNACLDERAIDFVLTIKEQIIKENPAMEYADSVPVTDLGGLDLLKTWSDSARVAMTEKARAFGIVAPKGVFLVGIPGCGKSLAAKTFAQGMPLIRFNFAATQSKFVGESGANLRNAFKVAEAVAPVIFWIDEIDKVLSVGGGESTTGSVQFQQLGELLTWMQEKRDNGVFIVATANYVAGIDPALMSRFDRTFFVDFPSPEERREIFAIHILKKGRDPQNYDLDALARATNEFTGREIEQIVNGALVRAFTHNRDLTTGDLLTEVSAIIPLAEKMKQQLAEMRVWAEQANPASSRQASGHKLNQPSSYLEL